MHLLVPFASDLSEACRQVLRDLALPRLARLLALLTPAGRDEGEASSYSPPHERALAAAWGWRGGDGTLPFAAHAARGDGVAVGDIAWGLLTPAHWLLGRDHVTMTDPAGLGLGESESRTLFDSVCGLLEEDGFAVAWGGADRWYAGRTDLEGFATASLDRVIGRDVDAWLQHAPPGAAGGGDRAATGRLVRRLQSEVQLLLHAHPVNEAREEHGDPVVNSFWLSGCGRAQAAEPAKTPVVDESLRAPLLARDWVGWAEAWQALDRGPIAGLQARAEAGESVALTLCGERTAARFELRPRSLWQRASDRWRRAETHAVLEGL